MSNWDLILQQEQARVYQGSAHSYEYDQGYSKGYREGYADATKHTMAILEKLAKPTKIELVLPAGVPPETVEKIKKEIFEANVEVRL